MKANDSLTSAKNAEYNSIASFTTKSIQFTDTIYLLVYPDILIYWIFIYIIALVGVIS